MTLDSEAFRIAETLYVRSVDDDELIQMCKSVAHQLGVGWRNVWNAVRCAYNSSFYSEG